MKNDNNDNSVNFNSFNIQHDRICRLGAAHK